MVWAARHDGVQSEASAQESRFGLLRGSDYTGTTIMTQSRLRGEGHCACRELSLWHVNLRSRHIAFETYTAASPRRPDVRRADLSMLDQLLPPRVRRDAADGEVDFDETFGIG